MEIRIVAVLLISTFDISLAPGEDGKRMFGELEDFFTTTPGPLKVILRERTPVAT